METVAIVGVGLIGASFGLALREAGFSGELIGVSSPSAIEAGVAAGAIGRGDTLENAAAAADLIYLAQPVDRIMVTLGKLRPFLRPDALVTDAGSTKQSIVVRAVQTLPSSQFLGGHPMAGKEKRGAGAADAALFRNRPYILTPAGPESPMSEAFQMWLARIGAKILTMSALEHDNTVALTSQLPQLISYALALTLARQKNPQVGEVFGPGLLDMTRLAMSSPEVWLPIISTNRTNLVASLSAFIASVNEIQDAIQKTTLRELLGTSVAMAERIRRVDSPTPGSIT